MKSTSYITSALTLITATTLAHAASPLENPLFPASGPATSSFNGLHPKSKFLAINNSAASGTAANTGANCSAMTKPTPMMSFLN